MNAFVGSDMSKILMASTLSRMELIDQSKASLGEDGAIKALVKMFNGGKLEAKLLALSALQNLSSLKENFQRLIDTGLIASLLQLLFSVTSVLMTLSQGTSLSYSCKDCAIRNHSCQPRCCSTNALTSKPL